MYRTVLCDGEKTDTCKSWTARSPCLDGPLVCNLRFFCRSARHDEQIHDEVELLEANLEAVRICRLSRKRLIQKMMWV